MSDEEGNYGEKFTTKVFTSDDRALKLLGELLSNQVSRDIIRLLMEKEMYANEIANKLDIQFNLISHHLKKMGELGLLSVSEKRIVRKGQLHKYYKINPGIFLLPSHTEDRVSDNGILKKIFKDGIKFTAVGLSAIFAWFSTEKTVKITQPHIMQNQANDTSIPENITDPIVETTTSYDPLIPIIVIACGLFLIYFSKRHK